MWEGKVGGYTTVQWGLLIAGRHWPHSCLGGTSLDTLILSSPHRYFYFRNCFIACQNVWQDFAQFSSFCDKLGH